MIMNPAGTDMKCGAMIAVVATVALSLLPVSAAYNAAGGYVTLLADNSGNSGHSTFVTNIVRSGKYGWSDGKDPHPGTNYYCNVQLCTPRVLNSEYTFAGDRLVLDDEFRFLADNTKITVNDLWLEDGCRFQTAGGNFDVTVKGRITVLAGSGSPLQFSLGGNDQFYKIEAAFTGDSSACAYVTTFVSLHGEKTPYRSQYVEFDDADEYFGTLEVRASGCVKLASDLPGTVSVSKEGIFAALGDVTVGALHLDNCELDLSAGEISVTDGFSAAGRIKIKVDRSVTSLQPVLIVPSGKGVIDAALFFSDGVRFSVAEADGVQTLYAEAYAGVLEHAVFDETTGFVVQKKGGSSNSSLRNVFDEADAWSDGKIPHSDTNYCEAKSIYITTNSVFQGKSLTMGRGSFRLGEDVSVTIADFRVRSGASYISAILTTAGGIGKYYLYGGMRVLSRVTDNWPFAFLGGGNGQTWISHQKITGWKNRAFAMRGHYNNAPGAVSNYTELHGDLSEYFGTIIVGTNFTVRLGGSMPGTVRLDTAHSRLDTIAPDGAEVMLAKLDSRFPTSVSVAETNTLAVTEALAVTGALTKNGSGVFASGGALSAGADAALHVASGGLRADSAHAFDGIPVSFADGAEYVRDLAADDDEIALYGLFDSEPVTVSGTLVVDIVNFSGSGRSQEVALFTVPESCAEALAGAIRFKSRPKGYVLSVAVADADGGMKTVKAVCNVVAMTISIR